MKLSKIYFYKSSEFKYGLICSICKHVFKKEGEPYLAVPHKQDISMLQCLKCKDRKDWA